MAMRSLEQQRQDARIIFAAGLEAADPAAAIRQWARIDGDIFLVGGRSYDLAKVNAIYVMGAGKATAKMARAIEELLGGRITRGLVIVKAGHAVPLQKVAMVEAGHPVPDAAGVAATENIISLLQRSREQDLIICLISGGASALLCCPTKSVSLRDKQKTTQVLLNCGANIQEINAIRKHISRVKGGRLAELAQPSTVASLFLSDVIGDSIDQIGSGPTAPDSSTFADCLMVMQRYHVAAMIPRAVRDRLERGAAGAIAETPKPGNPIFRKVQNLIVGDNQLALSAARDKAEALGYRTMVLSNSIEGEARKVAIDHAATARELASARGARKPICLISGGETTVTVRGKGSGGRNQEFALAAAIEIDGMDGIVVLSGGTDGSDGPTDAAGGIVDGTTLRRGRKKGLDARTHLAANDSYPFLKSIGDLLMTGPTLTNVMDLRLVLLS
jgi:hydroxypyruvate reductase